MINNKIRSVLLIFILSALIITCKKNNINNEQVQQPGEVKIDLSIKVTSSVSGFVTNEADATVEGANVQFGASTTTTDKYGYFEIKNVNVSAQAAFVTVNMNGYFKSIKTFVASEGKENFCRIKLIPKTNTGTINASSGGDVTLANGLSISFPANEIIDVATQTAYSGTVNVSSYWIDPTATDLDKIMPGDLRGINETNLLRGLTTFGMAAVELTGSNGELLQVAAGKTASLTIPIPNAILANAPSTIPLWYFDETIGLWKEEGSATKSGNNYTGEVKHFSFWNCDMPYNNLIQFDCTITDESDHPVSGIDVKITTLNASYGSAHGYTNAQGYVSGIIPANEQLVLELIHENCIVLSMQFSSNSVAGQALSLGKIIVQGIHTLALSGIVLNCNNEPVTHGRIFAIRNNQYLQYPINNDGTYNFLQLWCNDTARLLFIAEDFDAHKQSFPIVLDLSGNNHVHNFQACDVPTQEFIHYTIDGTPYTYTFPTATLFAKNYNLEYLSMAGRPTNNDPSIFIDIHDSTPGIAGTRILYGFHPYQPILGPGVTSYNPVIVHLTEYGQVGEFVAGYFEGNFHILWPIGPDHHVECSFRIRVSP